MITIDEFEELSEINELYNNMFYSFLKKEIFNGDIIDCLKKYKLPQLKIIYKCFHGKLDKKSKSELIDSIAEFYKNENIITTLEIALFNAPLDSVKLLKKICKNKKTKLNKKEALSLSSSLNLGYLFISKNENTYNVYIPTLIKETIDNLINNSLIKLLKIKENLFVLTDTMVLLYGFVTIEELIDHYFLLFDNKKLHKDEIIFFLLTHPDTKELFELDFNNDTIFDLDLYDHNLINDIKEKQNKYPRYKLNDIKLTTDHLYDFYEHTIEYETLKYTLVSYGFDEKMTTIILTDILYRYRKLNLPLEESLSLIASKMDYDYFLSDDDLKKSMIKFLEIIRTPWLNGNSYKEIEDNSDTINRKPQVYYLKTFNNYNFN